MKKQITNPHNLNLPLFLKIVRVIEAEPKRAEMSNWARTENQIEELYSIFPEDDPEVERVKNLPLPACGTVACIAGWAQILSEPEVRKRAGRSKDGVPVKALSRLIDTCVIDVSGNIGSNALGLGWDAWESRDARRLFYVSKWDDKEAKGLYEKADAANDPEGRARAVIMRIESFLTSMGVDLKQFYAQKV